MNTNLLETYQFAESYARERREESRQARLSREAHKQTRRQPRK